MPRAKPRIGKIDFDAKPYRLDLATRSQLVGFLGRGERFNRQDDHHVKVIDEVEKWLGFYWPARETAMNLPRPADFKRALAELYKSGTIPLDEQRFHQRILDVVRKANGKGKRAADVVAAEIRQELMAQAVIEGRGRIPQDYFHKLLKELRKTFQRYYVSHEPVRLATGEPFEPLSNAEFDEVQFLEFALESIGIRPADNLRRYFTNPGVALPAERTKVVDALAKKRFKLLKNKMNLR